MLSYIPEKLRRMVYERANGLCEYCLIPDTVVLAAHGLDHIIPKKHGGQTESGNLALSCSLCNKHKGTDLASLDPVTAKVVALYHPRREQWADHFQLNHAQLIALTAIGRVTIRLLQLNKRSRIEERKLLIETGIFNVSE